MAYKLSTYFKARNLPVNFPLRKKAMSAARKELLSEGCELRRDCGDGISGWGNFWYTKDGLRICDKPNMNALETVIRFRMIIGNNRGN